MSWNDEQHILSAGNRVDAKMTKVLKAFSHSSEDKSRTWEEVSMFV